MYNAKSSLAIMAAVFIVLLLMPSVGAAPSLRLGSRSEYSLSGALQAQETCTAEPPEYTSQACGFGPPPPPPPPPPQDVFVTIRDNGVCPPNDITACGFVPNVVTVTVGAGVQWFNNGSLVHTVTSNGTANPGLPPFDSGLLPPSSIFRFTFFQPGTYFYFCRIHQWMKAVINVIGVAQPQPPLAQPPSSVRVNLDGNVAWDSIGLDDKVAVLEVAHEISVSIMPTPGVTFTPLVESGSFEEVVDRNTRAVSSGTATSIVEALISSLQRAYTGYSPPFLTMASHNLGSHQTIYTTWWVNGPLGLGSPVQIFTGWGSVTGEENLNLGILGTRAAWVVTSGFSQSFTAVDPYGGSSNIEFSLNLLWSYDKRGDLLLRDNATLNILAQSESRRSVIVSNPCAPTGWCPVYADVTVTREMTATITLALKLVSTNINLDARTRQRAALSSLWEMLAAFPWLPFGVAGAAVGALAGVGVWVRRRNGRKGEVSGEAPGLVPPT